MEIILFILYFKLFVWYNFYIRFFFCLKRIHNVNWNFNIAMILNTIKYEKETRRYQNTLLPKNAQRRKAGHVENIKQK